MVAVSSDVWAAIGSIAAVVGVPLTLLGLWLQWRRSRAAELQPADLEAWSSLQAWLVQNPSGMVLLGQLRQDPHSVARQVVDLLRAEPGVALTENDEATIARLVETGADHGELSPVGPTRQVESGQALLKRLRTLDVTRDHPQSRPSAGEVPRHR